MNAVDFINKCDWEGGLSEFFEYGFEPSQLDSNTDLEFRKIISQAYKSWQDFQKYKDEYYALVETGEY